MRWKGKFALGLAAALSSAAAIQAQVLPTVPSTSPQMPAMQQDAKPASSARILAVSGQVIVAQAAEKPPLGQAAPKAGAPPQVTETVPEAAPAPDSGPGLGPTPLNKVGILQGLIFGDNDKPPINISGWADFDYTYRSTGRGINPIAPVMNRFGDEFLVR